MVVIMSSTHPEQEDFPWTIAVVDHPNRTDSPAYTKSRKLMNALAKTLTDWPFTPTPYQDHHGGSVWVKDAAGWLCLQVSLGIEWSAQFCADPAKVDRLRLQAQRVVTAFPATLPGYEAAGYHDAEALLATKITTADQVGAWTDSIFNASLPLPVAAHTGVLPKGAGYHHYPKPIVDIDHVRFDDFRLFVTDPDGLPAVVVPLSARGTGDARVRLLAAHPDSAYVARLVRPAARDTVRRGAAPAAAEILSADDPLARQAFAGQ
jgi:Family of unknown function (DUF6424)